VFILDALKGVVAIVIANELCPGQLVVAVLCGICVIIGHNWPIFFGFKGGKGIATTIGVMFALSFLPTLFAAIIAVIVISVTRYVSLGSLLFTLFIPIFMLILNHSLILFWAACVVMIFAWFRHKTNIVKLLNGTENKLGAKKTV
jgi:glycerol-3-phosphate acyltransferase PlsY